MRTAILFLIAFVLGRVSANDTIDHRQQFFRAISKNPETAIKYINDKDQEIRRYAVYQVIKKDPIANFAIIENAVNDPDEQVRLTAFSVLPSLVGKDKRVIPLLQKIARHDTSIQIRKIAIQATWPFHREIKLLRNDPTWDYEVKTIKSISLAAQPWLFCTDPLQQGHLKGWYRKNFNTSKWKPIKMGPWESQGFPDYDGTAWYQIKFTMPPKIDCNAVEIAFDGVDESAWIWLNGIYLGAHDKGPEGWKEPFAVDCRKEILWGRENILTIRVYDAAYAGGIYKPIRVDILK